jgi:hypothetical protein
MRKYVPMRFPAPRQPRLWAARESARMGARRSRIGDTAAITRIIIRDGAPFAMLIDDPKLGRYLVPPIVLDDQGNVIEGHDALSAMHQAGVQIESTDGGVWKGRTPGGAKVVHPYLTDRMPGDLAQIDQVMAQLSGAFGMPIGPPVEG